jgi:hypothetical protein
MKPTVEALKRFLKTSGIDLELSRSLNVRLLDNIVILGRIQTFALEGRDRRDLVLLPKAKDQLPTPEESLRYVMDIRVMLLFILFSGLMDCLLLCLAAICDTPPPFTARA